MTRVHRLRLQCSDRYRSAPLSLHAMISHRHCLLGRPRTRIVQLSVSVMIRHHRPIPLSAADVCLRHAFQSYLCFGSVHSRCVPLRPRSALRAILVCVVAAHLRIISVLWIDALAMFSLTG